MLGAPTGWVVAVLLATVAPIGGAVLGLVGAVREGTGLRELAWEVQAVGTGLLAVAWLAALGAGTGRAGLTRAPVPPRTDPQGPDGRMGEGTPNAPAAQPLRS